MGMASGGLTAFANGGSSSVLGGNLGTLEEFKRRMIEEYMAAKPGATTQEAMAYANQNAESIYNQNLQQSQSIERPSIGLPDSSQIASNVLRNIEASYQPDSSLDMKTTAEKYEQLKAESVPVPFLQPGAEFLFGDEFKPGFGSADEISDLLTVSPFAALGAYRAGPLIGRGLSAGWQASKKGLGQAFDKFKRYFSAPATSPSGLVDDVAAYGGQGYQFLMNNPISRSIINNPLEYSALAATPTLPYLFNQFVGEDDATQVVDTTQSGDDSIDKKISDNDPRGNQAGNQAGTQAVTGSRTDVAIDSLMSSIANLPTVDVPEFTEADKQRELDVYTLGSLAKAFGSAKNLGDAAASVGEAAMGLPAIKESQRKRSLESASAQRQQSVESFNLTLAVEKLRTLAEQAINSRDSNLISIVNSLEKKLLEAYNSPLGVDEREAAIKTISDQINSLLGQSSFNIDTTPTRIRIPDKP
tara:strand:- start:85 stop:1500 length:1416 start_codon:yes stop_codon:yes gene_type:complete